MKPDPKTDAQLFDLIHELFGIGDWDRDLDEKAWHQVRLTEISKIKAIRKKRGYSIEELAELARYAHDRRHRVTRTWDLLQHWPSYRRARAADARLRQDQEFEQILEVERGRLDGDEWVTRLLLSTGNGREELVRKWREERQ